MRNKPAAIQKRTVAATLLASAASVAIALAVTQGNTQRLDDWVLRGLRTADNSSHLIGPSWVENFAKDLTALGSFPVLLVLTLAVVGFFAIRCEWRRVSVLALSSLGGVAFLELLKPFFGRARPNVVPHLIDVSTLSFPSGHATMSAVIYLTLGFVSASFLENARSRAYVVCVFSMATLVAGFTRMLLGVHYPSDVVAGWSFGLAWSLIAWMSVQYVSSRWPH